MTLKDVGDQLREERIRRGLSVEEVIRRTKISRRNLEALEEGRQSDLPHVVYVKGFIKTYAGLLQMNADEMGQAVDQSLGFKEEGWIDDVLPQQQEILADLPRKSKRPTVFSLIIVMLCLALAVAWFILDVRKEDSFSKQLISKLKTEQKATPQAPTEPEKLLAEDAQVVKDAAQSQEGATNAPMSDEEALKAAMARDMRTKENAEPASETALEDNAVEASGEALPAQDSEPASETAATGESAQESILAAPAEEALTLEKPQAQADNQILETEPRPAADEPETAEEAAAIPEGMQRIEIVANQSCWVEASDAKGNTRDALLRPGERMSVDFEERLSLRLGNAGGVDILYNGEPFDLKASSGQVKTVTFPPGDA